MVHGPEDASMGGERRGRIVRGARVEEKAAGELLEGKLANI